MSSSNSGSLNGVVNRAVIDYQIFYRLHTRQAARQVFERLADGLLFIETGYLNDQFQWSHIFSEIFKSEFTPMSIPLSKSLAND